MKAVLISYMIIFVSLSFQQCKTAEKTAVSCPELPAHKFSKTKTGIRGHNKTAFFKNPNLMINKGRSGAGMHLKNSSEYNYTGNRNSVQSVSAYLPCKTDFLNRLTVSENNSIAISLNDCDTIFLRSGSSINAKITRKGLNRIRYRDCNNLTGPVLSIPKSEVRSISYSNISQEYKNYKRTSDPVGIIGFVFSIAGLLFLGSLSFPFISLILTGGLLGWISANRIKNRPYKLKGRGLAGISIVLAYALLIFLVLFLVIVLIGKII